MECALEQHTIDSVSAIVSAQGWTKAVDLVDGGRVVLLFSPEEEAEARRRFDSARTAGLDTSAVQWLSRHEMNKARPQSPFIAMLWLMLPVQGYGIDYPAVRIPGRNVWPLKLVTRLFALAQSLASDVRLHTRTPVTSLSRSGSGWSLHTPRGSLRATYVLHATNGYAAHLLPQLSGPQGIIPVRGQVIATRASGPVPGKESYIGNDGFEYWFPRPTSSNREAPLFILGGGREIAPNYDMYVTDDAHVDPKVGDVLRKFLPSVCPRAFERGMQPEMEWVSATIAKT